MQGNQEHAVRARCSVQSDCSVYFILGYLTEPFSQVFSSSSTVRFCSVEKPKFVDIQNGKLRSEGTWRHMRASVRKAKNAQNGHLKRARHVGFHTASDKNQ